MNDAGLSPGIIFTGQTDAAGNELISRDILIVSCDFRNRNGGVRPLFRLNFIKFGAYEDI